MSNHKMCFFEAARCATPAYDAEMAYQQEEVTELRQLLNLDEEDELYLECEPNQVASREYLAH